MRGEHLACDRDGLVEAHRTAETLRADLQKNLVCDVVVRAVKELAEDLRKGARLAVNVDRGKARGHGSGRDLVGNATAGLLDERRKQLARVLQTQRRFLVQTDAAAAIRPPCPELADRKLGDRRLFLGGLNLVAAAHR